MTIDPAVKPVVDYEPPPRAVQHRRACSPARRATPGTPRRPAVVVSPVLHAAAAFADSALRRVLEVLDRRRPLAQLRPLLTPGLADSLLAMRPPGAGSGNAATLRRVRLQQVGFDDPPTAVEAFGTYTRGRRTHAVACRVERVPDSTPQLRWQIVALHIG